ncbi:MAG TPA: ABC transporter transmembrane domain-containing protein [Blastocatellia bacterium]|nr:ABC transporter transmembrane domain-containing protein [Blastocatellia bacterium]
MTLLLAGGLNDIVRPKSLTGPDLAEGRKSRGSPKDFLRLLTYARPYKGRLLLALVSLVVAGLLSLTYPQIVRFLIDAAFTQHDSHKLNLLALGLVGMFGIQAFFSFLRTYLLAYAGERIVADVRTELYSHLISLPVAFFASRRVGELTSRVASDVSVIQTTATSSTTELLRQTLVLTGGITIVAITNPRLTLAMLAIIPVLVLTARYYGQYVRKMSTSVQDRLADASSVLEETLSAISIVQSFVREEYERIRYRNRIHQALTIAISRALASGGFVAFIVFMVYGGIAVVLWLGSRMVLTGKMSAGELIAFVLYTFVVGGSIGGVSELYGQFQQALGASRRVFELLDTKPEITDPEQARALASVTGDVMINQVRFAYPDERGIEVLKGVTIEARSGEVIALVGPSGAGKSTLVTLIPRFFDVSAGSIEVDGHDIRRLRLADLRHSIGLVPQETILFGGTIQENIAYGKLDASREEIEAAARAAHAHEFVSAFPDGYETIVGERGVKLSGGQRQRIAIARALLKDPAILILDEATSSLDSESEQLIQEALETLMRGRTTFVIAHRLSTVRRADKIVVLNEGRVVEEGTHAELLAIQGLYKQLHDIQFRDIPPLGRSVAQDTALQFEPEHPA